MSLRFISTKRKAFSDPRWRWTVAYCVVLGALLSYAATAQASIMLTDVQAGASGFDEADRSNSAPAEQPIEQVENQLLLTIPSDGSSSGSSSSGASSGGGSSPPTALFSVAVPKLDAELLGCVSGQVRWSLPSPPGEGILRPPQDCCTSFA